MLLTLMKISAGLLQEIELPDPTKSPNLLTEL